MTDPRINIQRYKQTNKPGLPWIQMDLILVTHHPSAFRGFKRFFRIVI
jgi:hypothetical protein